MYNYYLLNVWLYVAQRTEAPNFCHVAGSSPASCSSNLTEGNYCITKACGWSDCKLYNIFCGNIATTLYLVIYCLQLHFGCDS